MRRSRGYGALLKSSGVAGQQETGKWAAVITQCAEGRVALPPSVRFIPKGVPIVLLASVCTIIVPLFVTCAVVAIRAELVPREHPRHAVSLSAQTPIGLLAAGALLVASAFVAWRTAKAALERSQIARGHYRLGLFLVPRDTLGERAHEPCIVLRLDGRPGRELVIPASAFVEVAEYRAFNAAGGINDELELRFSDVDGSARARLHMGELQATRAELVAALTQWASASVGVASPASPEPSGLPTRPAEEGTVASSAHNSLHTAQE